MGPEHIRSGPALAVDPQQGFLPELHFQTDHRHRMDPDGNDELIEAVAGESRQMDLCSTLLA